jgi:hypothetical protein
MTLWSYTTLTDAAPVRSFTGSSGLDQVIETGSNNSVSGMGSGHESRRGAGVKHLVELSKISWNL